MATFNHSGQLDRPLQLSNRAKIVGWLQERLEAMRGHKFVQRLLAFARAVLAALEREERRQACVRRLGPVMLVGIAGLVLMGQAAPKTETVQTERFPLIAMDKEPFQPYFLRGQEARVAIPTHYTPMTFAEFFALPALPEDYGQSDWTTVREYTQRAVSLEGYTAELLRSTGRFFGLLQWREGDIHVLLRETPQPRCSTDGNRREQIVAAVTRAFQGPTTGWSYDALRDLCDHQARVRVSGWLLHDFEHVRDVGERRGSAWEIYPVTRIEVWEPDRQLWLPLH